MTELSSESCKKVFLGFFFDILAINRQGCVRGTNGSVAGTFTFSKF